MRWTRTLVAPAPTPAPPAGVCTTSRLLDAFRRRNFIFAAMAFQPPTCLPPLQTLHTTQPRTHTITRTRVGVYRSGWPDSATPTSPQTGLVITCHDTYLESLPLTLDGRNRDGAVTSHTHSHPSDGHDHHERVRTCVASITRSSPSLNVAPSWSGSESSPTDRPPDRPPDRSLLEWVEPESRRLGGCAVAGATAAAARSASDSVAVLVALVCLDFPTTVSRMERPTTVTMDLISPPDLRNRRATSARPCLTFSFRRSRRCWTACLPRASRPWLCALDSRRAAMAWHHNP